MHDDDDEIEVPGLGRRRTKQPSAPLSAGGVVALSLFTAVLASAATAALLLRSGVLGHGAPSGAAPSVAALPSTLASASASAVSGEVRVPDLVRVPAENARSIADALGLRLVLRERRADPAIAAETVAAQSPTAGSMAHRGDSLEVVVSSGAALVAPAPSTASAGALAPSASAPSSASAIAAPSAAAIVDPSNSVEVPRLVGQRIHRARSAVTSAGLELGSQREIFDEDHGPHVVLRQSIAAGTRVARGTRIDLVYNQGE